MTRVNLHIPEEIIKLTKLWYSIVGTDHHKDRDCHWYINTVYSYGQPPIYRLEHYGYVWKNVDEEFESYSEAENALFKELHEAIKAEREWAKEVKDSPQNWGEDQVERAKKILELIDQND